jgi:hypothetical protein
VPLRFRVPVPVVVGDRRVRGRGAAGDQLRAGHRRAADGDGQCGGGSAAGGGAQQPPQHQGGEAAGDQPHAVPVPFPRRRRDGREAGAGVPRGGHDLFQPHRVIDPLGHHLDLRLLPGEDVPDVPLAVFWHSDAIG